MTSASEGALGMTEPMIGWRPRGYDGEWDPQESARLDRVARQAAEHFKSVAGYPLSIHRRGGEVGEVARARQQAVQAHIALAGHWRLQDNPHAQWRAYILECDALRWHESADDVRMSHGARQAEYWYRRLLDLFTWFSRRFARPPSRRMAVGALRLIIRHGMVCPGCDTISFHGDPPKGKKCDTCRRWDRRLKPYPGLPTRRAFSVLLRQQGDKCALCTESDPPVPEGALDGWHIDHDHATGKVRGILCPSCNAKVGKHEADRGARGAIEDYLNR